MDNFNEKNFLDNLVHIPQILSMMQNAIKNGEDDQDNQLNQYMTWLETYVITMQDCMGYAEGEFKSRIEQYQKEIRKSMKIIRDLKEAMGKEFTPEKVVDGFANMAGEIKDKLRSLGIINITMSAHGNIEISCNFSIHRPSTYDQKYYKSEEEFNTFMNKGNAEVDFIISQFECIPDSDSDNRYDILYNDNNKEKIKNYILSILPEANCFKYDIKSYETTIFDKIHFSFNKTSLFAMMEVFN